MALYANSLKMAKCLVNGTQHNAIQNNRLVIGTPPRRIVGFEEVESSAFFNSITDILGISPQGDYYVTLLRNTPNILSFRPINNPSLTPLHVTLPFTGQAIVRCSPELNVFLVTRPNGTMTDLWELVRASNGAFSIKYSNGSIFSENFEWIAISKDSRFLYTQPTSTTQTRYWYKINLFRDTGLPPSKTLIRPSASTLFPTGKVCRLFGHPTESTWVSQSQAAGISLGSLVGANAGDINPQLRRESNLPFNGFGFISMIPGWHQYDPNNTMTIYSYNLSTRQLVSAQFSLVGASVPATLTYYDLTVSNNENHRAIISDGDKGAITVIDGQYLHLPKGATEWVPLNDDPAFPFLYVPHNLNSDYTCSYSYADHVFAVAGSTGKILRKVWSDE